MSEFLLELERLKRRQLGTDSSEDANVKHVRLDKTSSLSHQAPSGSGSRSSGSSQPPKKAFWVKDPHAIKAAVKGSGSNGSTNTSIGSKATHGKGGPSNEASQSDSKSLDSTTSTSQHADTDDAAGEAISILRVKRLLRQLGEPITLFGETDAERIQRLKQLQLKKHDIAQSATGQKNIMDDIKLQIENELQRSANDFDSTKAGGSDISARGNDLTTASDSTQGTETLDSTDSIDTLSSLDDAAERRRRLERAKEAEEAKRYEKDLPRSEFSTSNNYVRFCIKRWLWLWNMHLKRRDPAVAREPAGRQASELYAQTVEYLKPMMTELRDNTIEPDILEMLEKIVQLTQDREYLKANEEFLMLSIGDAAWPMGVTMVGIHERSGREKISKVAHMLNDEKKRKYIQALKRVLNFCQSAFPTVPSKMFV